MGRIAPILCEPWRHTPFRSARRGRERRAGGLFALFTLLELTLYGFEGQVDGFLE